ncbi:MAG: putative rod shape-determining protein MreC [Actinomycetota bacterium]
MARTRTTLTRAIILLALAAVFFITLDLSGSSSTTSIRRAFSTIFAPVEGVARVVTRPVSNAWKAIRNYDDVIDENDRLKEQVALQEGAAVAAAASVRLSQELLALNGLPTLAGINSVTAQVIGDTPTNFSQTVEINQGANSGIKVGMPVLNAAGLIGKVTEVFADRALVMLISDPDYALSVKVVTKSSRTPVTLPPLPTEDAPTVDSVLETTDTSSTSSTSSTTTTILGFTPGTTTIPPEVVAGAGGGSNITVPVASQLAVRETGILEGRGPGTRPIVRFLDASTRGSAIEVGAPIVSAGGSRSLAPPDIVIGVVSRVVERLGTAGPVLEIDLVADLSSLSFLRVLLYQPITETGK